MKTRRAFEILLITVIALRATAFMFTKICVETMGPFTLSAVRFVIAFLILAVLFWKKLAKADRNAVFQGGILGIGYFAMIATAAIALTDATSQTVALVQNSAIVFVPVFMIFIYRKKPKFVDMACAVLALIGVVCILLKGLSIEISTGMVFSLLSALAYTISIIATDKIAKESDAMLIGIIQTGFIALYSVIFAFILEDPVLPSGGYQWFCVLFLAVVCSAIGWALQPVGQQGTTPERAGLFCSVSPAIAALLGAIFLHEKLSVTGIIGMILILGALLISSYYSTKTSSSTKASHTTSSCSENKTA